MTEKHPLGISTLLQPIYSPALRCDFLNEIFNTKLDILSVEATDNAYEAFFSRYHTQCALAANKSPDIENVTHMELLQVIHWLEPLAERESRIALVQRKASFPVSENLAETLTDLAASTWLMLSIGKFPGDISYDEHVIWGKGLLHSGLPKDTEATELSDSVIKRTFPSEYTSKDTVKLPQSFTAAHLEKIGGIEIRWTNNLADHLLLRDDDTKLMLFHQVSILNLHLASESSPLPKDLVDETIRTISLFLPPVLGEPNPWFQVEKQKHRLDANAGLCKRLNSSERQIGRFTYWRDRVVLLKRTFDDTEPRTISQLYHDDRKKTQWFTFWVAVLVFFVTIFFGVIQSVASIIQAWASVKALRSPE
ncbi:MAG: hypothetical protein Q9217_004000 [Psora testacea]